MSARAVLIRHFRLDCKKKQFAVEMVRALNPEPVYQQSILAAEHYFWVRKFHHVCLW